MGPRERGRCQQEEGGPNCLIVIRFDPAAPHVLARCRVSDLAESLAKTTTRLLLIILLFIFSYAASRSTPQRIQLDSARRVDPKHSTAGARTSFQRRAVSVRQLIHPGEFPPPAIRLAALATLATLRSESNRTVHSYLSPGNFRHFARHLPSANCSTITSASQPARHRNG